jgi:hypothetical protein
MQNAQVKGINKMGVSLGSASLDNQPGMKINNF